MVRRGVGEDVAMISAVAGVAEVLDHDGGEGSPS